MGTLQDGADEVRLVMELEADTVGDLLLRCTYTVVSVDSEMKYRVGDRCIMLSNE